jgi:hypothetical protein
MRKDTSVRDLSQYDCYDFIAAHPYQIPWCDEFINIVLTRHTHEGKRGVCGPLVFDHTIPEGQPVEPTFRLQHEEAQHLMDRLWDIGLRPTQAKASTGQAEATLRHLEDMRVLAFHTLDIPKP